jgi:hypothetical protein
MLKLNNMKRVTFKILLPVIFIVAFGTNVLAAKEEFSKVLQKEFPANTQTDLEINNKYGDVHIENWDQNSIRIVVKITVDARDKNAADDLLDKLNVDFAQEGNHISAITKIAEDFGKSHFSFGNNGKKFSIDYTVNMPKSNALKIINKYGNIFIDEMNGFVDVDLKYGEMNINKLSRADEKPMNQIVMAYAKAHIIDCNWLKLQVSYSGIDIERSKALILLSKYSQGNLGRTSSLVGDNSYDTYQVDALSNLVIEGKYSNFKINNVAKKVNLNTKFTDFQISSIPAGFESIEVNNQYGKIDLGIERGASYKLDATAKYTNIDYPSENAKVNKISENTRMSVNGTVGNNPKASVKINTEYGGVKLIR